jgi:hypothetical protein
MVRSEMSKKPKNGDFGRGHNHQLSTQSINPNDWIITPNGDILSDSYSQLIRRLPDFITVLGTD